MFLVPDNYAPRFARGLIIFPNQDERLRHPAGLPGVRAGAGVPQDRRVLRGQELLPPHDIDPPLLRPLRRRRLRQVTLGKEVGAQPQGISQIDAYWTRI